MRANRLPGRHVHLSRSRWRKARSAQDGTGTSCATSYDGPRPPKDAILLSETGQLTGMGAATFLTTSFTLSRFHQLIVEAAESIGYRLSNRDNPSSDTDIMETATAWLAQPEHPYDSGSGHAAMLLWRQHGGGCALVALDQHLQGRVT